MSQNEWTPSKPLPPRPGVEQFPRDPRREREMTPTNSDAKFMNRFPHVDAAKAADDARVRDAKVATFVDWHKRTKGTVPDEAAIRAFLGEDGQS